jgi:hypothetical protein
MLREASRVNLTPSPGIASPPTIVRLLVQYGSLADWFSNPWATPDLKLATWTGTYQLRKLTVKWTRTPTIGVVQDMDMCTFHFLNITAGNPDDTWTDADFTTVESGMDAYWTTLKYAYGSETKLAEYHWQADGPQFKPHGALLSPTVRVVTKSVPGTASGPNMLPPQCATSVTEVTSSHYTAYGVGVPGHEPGTGRTQVRNRWGRFYLPATDAINTISDGRFIGPWCSNAADGARTWYNACIAAQIVPVVYSPTTGNSFSIDAIHVDDIVDVVRSRRYVTPTTRQPRTINAL